MQVHIRLTATAQDHARKHALVTWLGQLKLGPEVQEGDLVVLQEVGPEAKFIVCSRCWQVAASGDAQLVVELDYPPRPAGLR